MAKKHKVKALRKRTKRAERVARQTEQQAEKDIGELRARVSKLDGLLASTRAESESTALVLAGARERVEKLEGLLAENGERLQERNAEIHRLTCEVEAAEQRAADAACEAQRAIEAANEAADARIDESEREIRAGFMNDTRELRARLRRTLDEPPAPAWARKEMSRLIRLNTAQSPDLPARESKFIRRLFKWIRGQVDAFGADAPRGDGDGAELTTTTDGASA